MLEVTPYTELTGDCIMILLSLCNVVYCGSNEYDICFYCLMTLSTDYNIFPSLLAMAHSQLSRYVVPHHHSSMTPYHVWLQHQCPLLHHLHLSTAQRQLTRHQLTLHTGQLSTIAGREKLNELTNP